MLQLAGDSVRKNYQIASRIVVGQLCERGPFVEGCPEDVEKRSQKACLVFREFKLNGFLYELVSAAVAL